MPINKIFIIILHYNGFEDLKKCLETLPRLSVKDCQIQTLVVDNGSKPRVLADLKVFLKQNTGSNGLHLQNLRLIENGRNLGFAKGNNVGIKLALNDGADYILLLNNDTKIEMNFLESLLKLDAPIASPIVKFREFKDKPKLMFDLGGFVNWWTGRTYHLNAYKEDLKGFKKRFFLEADYVAGCCMLIKREVFERIGLLDEKYFIYFEDVDFCITAKKHGFKVIVDLKSVIYHKLGGSMDRWSKRAIFHNLVGNLIFITKHLGLRRVTGYAYLFFLTAKIVRDRIIDDLRLKNWRGARHNFHGK